jgi:Tol biopolymer transport system component
MTTSSQSSSRKPLGIFLWVLLGLAGICCIGAIAFLAIFRSNSRSQEALAVPLAPECSPETTPPAIDRIIFISERDGHSEIYAMNADGSDQLRMTNSPIAATAPHWSPDGKTIFFTSQVDPNLPQQGDLFMMNADGSGQTQVTAQDEREDLAGRSPDGKLIVSFDRPNIFVSNADGSGRKQLTSENFNEHPTWSPDGSFIAFISSYGGGEAPLYTFLYIIRPDGTGQTKLMDNVVTWSPNWSPDGKRIAILASDLRHIYIIKADGSGAIRIPNRGGLRSAEWSSDGGWLAFDTNGSDGFLDIAVTKSTCAGFWRLTNTPGNDYDPAWQPK